MTDAPFSCLYSVHAFLNSETNDNDEQLKTEYKTPILHVLYTCINTFYFVLKFRCSFDERRFYLVPPNIAHRLNNRVATAVANHVTRSPATLLVNRRDASLNRQSRDSFHEWMSSTK